LNIVNDVEKENQVMKLEEEDAQEDYQKFMVDAKEKRAADSKSMFDARVPWRKLMSRWWPTRAH